MEKQSPQIRRLKLPVACGGGTSKPSPYTDASHSGTEEGSVESPLTARKLRTTETQLQWARRIQWGDPQDCRDEFMSIDELLAINEEQQALLMESFLVLALQNTRVQNRVNDASSHE